MQIKMYFILYVITMSLGLVAVVAGGYNVTRFSEFYPGNTNSDISYPIVVNDKLVFQATNPNNGSELWVLDSATMDPAILKDLAPGVSAGMSGEMSMRTFGDVAFFNTGSRGMSNWDNRNGLHRTDGTTGGTKVVDKDLETAVGGSPYPMPGENIGAQLSSTEIILGLKRQDWLKRCTSLQNGWNKSNFDTKLFQRSV